jgi:hypothetical protein
MTRTIFVDYPYFVAYHSTLGAARGLGKAIAVAAIDGHTYQAGDNSLQLGTFSFAIFGI